MEEIRRAEQNVIERYRTVQNGIDWYWDILLIIKRDVYESCESSEEKKHIYMFKLNENNDMELYRIKSN